jgi:hypothetical protein
MIEKEKRKTKAITVKPLDNVPLYNVTLFMTILDKGMCLKILMAEITHPYNVHL